MKELELNWQVRNSAARCGIYMLMLGEKVQYVGQSVDCDVRVSEHRCGKFIEFDSVRVAEVPASLLLSEEIRMIREHNPPFNIAHTDKSKKRRTTNCGPNEFPRSVRWRGENMEHARTLAQMERRSLNDWLNLTVERLWDESRQKNQ